MRDIRKRLICVAVLVLLTVPIVCSVVLQGVVTAVVANSEPEVGETTVSPSVPETTTAADSLVLSAPAENPCTVETPSVNISGYCAPHLPLTVNGQTVPTSPDGQFSYDCPLAVGENTVTVSNTEKEIVLTVTYARTLLRAVNPAQRVTAQGGMLLEVSCEALAGSKVTASLSGQTVSLAPTTENTLPDGFVQYSGQMTLPAAQYEVQKLGKMRFTASFDGQSQTIAGGSVQIEALTYADIPIETGQGAVKAPIVSGDGLVQTLNPDTDYGKGVARMLKITADYAETCPGNTADDKSSPLCTPFLRGTYDYVVGAGHFGDKDYYITKSGYKVEQAKSECFDGYILPTNTVSVHKSYTDGETTAVLTMNWKVPFVSELKKQAYYKGYTGRVFNVTNSTAEYIDFTFYYTNAAEGAFDFSGSNTVRNAEWVNVGTDGTTTLRVYLRNSGKFYGYRAYYASDNRLVISFRNHPKTLSDTVILLDPGHGGKDCGAIGANGVYEATLNLRIAALVKQKLEAAGVRVVISRTADVYVDPEARRSLGRETGADAFVSIHCNSNNSASLSGTEVYYYRAYAQPLAKSIHAQLATAWNGIYVNDAYMQSRIVPADGGVRYYPFKVTRIEECPAVLIECGYLSNGTECSQLCLPAVQESMADAIARGILLYCQQ